MYNLNEILDKPISKLTDEEYLISQWKETGIKFLNEYFNGELPNYEINFNDFITDYCIVNSDFSQLILSGLKRLNRQIYDEIPETLGTSGNSGFIALCIFLRLLGINTI